MYPENKVYSKKKAREPKYIHGCMLVAGLKACKRESKADNTSPLNPNPLD
jgi:hypothetical protein